MAGKLMNAAARWQQAMASGATAQAYKDGIDQTTVNPMERAAAAEDRYVAGVQDAVSSGRRRNKLLATPISAWKDGSKNKGAQRLASGAQGAAGKVAAHFQKFTPVYQAIKDTVANMPKGGTENALERVRVAMTMLKQAAGKS